MYTHDGVLPEKLYRGSFLKFRDIKESQLYDGADLCNAVPSQEGLQLPGIYPCESDSRSGSETGSDDGIPGGPYEREYGAPDCGEPETSGAPQIKEKYSDSHAVCPAEDEGEQAGNNGV